MRVIFREGFLFLGVLALSGCGDRASDQSLIYDAQAAAAHALRDPDSARFEGAYVVRQPADKNGFVNYAVCGMVNGRNGFGGYAGLSRFLVTGAYEMPGGGPIGKLYPSFEVGLTEPWSGEGDPAGRESRFEHVYWNKSCVDAAHPKTHLQTY